MSLALAILNICVAMSIHVTATAPTPSIPKSRRLVGDYPGILYISFLILKYGCWLHAMIEVSISMANMITAKTPESTLLQWMAVQPTLTPTRFIAGVGVVLGGIGRHLCYRELGRQYTFHVSVLQNHSLVTTGPYRFVRHPGYTSGSLALVSLLAWYAASGSWLRESGAYRAPLAWTILFPATFSVGSLLLLFMRRRIEDGLMRKEFGNKWGEWARVVRYRLVPGVY